MKIHPICELVPAMTSDEFQKLAQDIKEHGLLHPIVTYDGCILDGRHRFKACESAGVPPRFTEFTGDDAAAVALVRSENLNRRQLSKSQLAMVGAKLKAWYSAKAKKRQLATLKQNAVVENCPQRALDHGKARDHAAKDVGVCGKMIDQAEHVMRNAVPEVTRLVESGAMALNEAAKIAEFKNETQRRIASQPTKRMRQGDLKSAMKKSNAGKKTSRLVQPSDAPGSPLVRTLLSRLELLTNEIERSGMSPQQFAERFVAEFDWKEPLLVRRMSYVSKSIDMLTTLSVISQRAARQAA